MKEQNKSVKQLVEQALQNDHEAFSQLYYQTYDRNYYLVLKLVKNEQDTEDILQDVYIKILKNLSKYQYKGESSFASWTSAIASNTALDFLRKKRPTLFSELSEEEENLFDTADESIEFQPEQRYDQKETSEIVSMILSELSEEQRICIILFYLQNLSIKEIAAQCHCSENTIKSRLNYGRRKIRGQADTLKKYGIHVGQASMLGVLVYFVQNDMAFAKSISPFEAGRKAANLLTTVSSGSGLEKSLVAETGKGVVAASKAATAVGVKKMTAVGIAGMITLAGAGGYVLHSLTPFSKPVGATATPFLATPVATLDITDTPEDTALFVPTETPEPTETVTKKPKVQPTVVLTKKPKVDPTVMLTKKPVITAKPTMKPTAKPTRKPTEKPTKKPTEKQSSNDDSMEWEDDYIKWEDEE